MTHPHLPPPDCDLAALIARRLPGPRAKGWPGRERDLSAHLDRLRAAYHTDFARLLDGLAARHGVKWQVPPLHLSQMLHTLWTGYVVQSPNDRPSLADALNIICHATIDFPQDD